MLLRESSDGSLSAYNALFDECYHSLKDGALNETLHKHIYPSLAHLTSINTTNAILESSIANIIKKEDFPSALPQHIYALDICFGLGYNSFALLATLATMGYEGEISIYSPEQDYNIFDNLLDFTYPPFLSAYQKPINELLRFCAATPNSCVCVKSMAFHTLKLNFYIYRGDALAMLALLPKDYFYIIYQDAFSPKKNPALWSEAYFRTLFTLLDSQGIITTYSQSSAIVKNAINAGFKEYNYESSLVRPSTLMGKNALTLNDIKQRFKK